MKYDEEDSNLYCKLTEDEVNFLLTAYKLSAFSKELVSYICLKESLSWKKKVTQVAISKSLVG